MARIGCLAGRDRAFTDAFIERINAAGAHQADYLTLGGVRMAEPSPYAVIVDRLSHAVPFYQSALKNAAVMGCHVLNDPFWQLAADRFLDTSLVLSLGIRAPRTVLLPNRTHIEGVVPESLRNRAEPLDWEGAMAWVGFPMILRAHWGAGARKAFLIHTPEELAARWEQSGTGQYILQEWLTGANYVYCLVVGDEALTITRPLRRPPDGSAGDTTPADKVAQDAVALSRALGYTLNAVEFAVRDGEVYATDWLNHCPPIDPTALTAGEFDWAVDRTAALAGRLAEAPAPRYRWDRVAVAAG
jgi:glutathione synthase/RimK-type ligase-like ATP-grasp enzyme